MTADERRALMSRQRRLTELGLVLKGKKPTDPRKLLGEIDIELRLHLMGKRGRYERRHDWTLWEARLNVWLDTRIEVMRQLGVEFPEPDWEALGVGFRDVPEYLKALEEGSAHVEVPKD